MICDRGNGVQKLLFLLLVAGSLPLGACFKVGPKVVEPAISIEFPVGNISLTAGQARVISAQVYDQNGQGVTWSDSPLNFGTLTNATFAPSTSTTPPIASVTYTCPTTLASPSSVTLTATSITNPAVSSSTTVHCSPVVVALQTATGLPMAAQNLGPAGAFFIVAFVLNDQANLGVTWAVSPSTGVGSISGSGPNNTFGLYTAPSTISLPATAVITATSVTDPSVSASVQVTVLPSGSGGNVAVLNVNGGPVPGQVSPNGAYTSVTICNHGSTTNCQTVDGVLVDTGSYGLRILQSQISSLNLSKATDPNGNFLENCASFPDGSVLWGTVERADVYITANEAAANLPIQVIPSTPTTVPDGCSNTGAFTISTPQLLGANGILGVGPEPTDCTLSGINFCDGTHQSTPPNLYYSCPSAGCTANASPVVVSALSQVSNPVPYFTGAFSSPNPTPDGNGVVIQLPSVSDPQASAIGTLTFGIATEQNNSLGTATVLTLDANDNFTTVVNGQTLTQSFIDSGSNALFFPDSLAACSTNKNFYCPSSPVMLFATNSGATQGQSTVDFTVEDADSLLFAFPQYAVFPTIAGPCSQGSSACGFLWGLPFFYGRTVYVAIDGQKVFGAPVGPWWAY